MPGVAVINQALARKYFPGEDPIGQRIANDEGGIPSTWEIVGVVDDLREGPLDVDICPRSISPLTRRATALSPLPCVRSKTRGAPPELVSTLHRIDRTWVYPAKRP